MLPAALGRTASSCFAQAGTGPSRATWRCDLPLTRSFQQATAAPVGALSSKCKGLSKLRSRSVDRLSSTIVAAAPEDAASATPERVEIEESEKGWHRPDLNLVLVHPQIPQNTGNIARTCAATAVALHLVEPIGFDLDSKALKRAGLDYWPYVCVNVHKSWEAFHEFFLEQPGPKRLFAFSKFSNRHYAAPGTYTPGDWLMYGAETTGLPPEAHAAADASGGGVVKIPMQEKYVRSLNLSVSVGIGLFEAMRQLDQPTADTEC